MDVHHVHLDQEIFRDDATKGDNNTESVAIGELADTPEIIGDFQVVVERPLLHLCGNGGRPTTSTRIWTSDDESNLMTGRIEGFKHHRCRCRRAQKNDATAHGCVPKVSRD
jgi:hypothetical protein